jgi:hypothetical protein
MVSCDFPLNQSTSAAAPLSEKDKITDGEDFELNRWRCLETPDRAYPGERKGSGTCVVNMIIWEFFEMGGTPIAILWKIPI